MSHIESVRLTDEQTLVILDQTLLPGETTYNTLRTKEDVFNAIVALQVRGAPAIGIAAAYGAYVELARHSYASVDDLTRYFYEVKAYLAASRPTAVNLVWALERLEQVVVQSWSSVEELLLALREEAEEIRREDARVCEAIGRHALALLPHDAGILTHCNAGGIATAKYGTALAPLFLGKEAGYSFRVYADETRPLLQGARLTAWELQQADIDVTLICDNMSSIVMQQGKVDAILVGCDRVAANGDTANKIGTSGLAIIAKHYGIPFYVCAPTSTIDVACLTGAEIEIEERNGAEITDTWYEKPMAPAGVKTYNPAFDVTDHSLITAIITENGVLYPDENGQFEVRQHVEV
ncbi:S-methyl-5-thioribose-1-phosphate isomerase [Paenalkalicoccus suaedae]|uniref:Methylthioribose-1-phosphate isomerase n=1 Tax=Paenalkalicoccus suaedae TaxID=2592382 RepID=A0A859FC84_9BACI|nr:S-methyl-5-thioribose-1-phosphate isomerase [Paenalkalicoccus suaedae]QKS69885.1 S-methyl-5-thioribose-1-phosphate isomerase [Paenalkalicoccus suaedae]